MNTTRIESIPLSRIVGSAFNPATRVHEFEKLQESIDRVGQLLPAVVVEQDNGTYAICDGHRRRAVLTRLGRTHMACLVQRNVEDAQKAVEELYVELNQGTKAFNGRDKLNAALQGGPTFDSNTKSAKLQLETLFTTEAERSFLVTNEVTTTVLSLAKKSTRYVLDGSGIGEDTPTFRDRVRKHVYYLLRNDVQQTVIAYMRQSMDRPKLKQAIDNNRPPPFLSSPKLKESWVK